MEYNTLIVTIENSAGIIRINRLPQKNSINIEFLREFNAVLDELERNDSVHAIVIRGNEHFFCTGMDLNMVSEDECNNIEQSSTKMYSDMLKRIALLCKPVITIVEGRTLAGGVGIVAASDLVIVGPNATFGLSEAIWGLLPSMVMPYLIRRVGYQRAYRMTLTAQNVDANQALEYCLADVLEKNPSAALAKYMVALSRVSKETVAEMKIYFRKMWIINDTIEAIAIDETTKLVNDPVVKENINNYVRYQRFPWEK